MTGTRGPVRGRRGAALAALWLLAAPAGARADPPPDAQAVEQAARAAPAPPSVSTSASSEAAASQAAPPAATAEAAPSAPADEVQAAAAEVKAAVEAAKAAAEAARTAAEAAKETAALVSRLAPPPPAAPPPPGEPPKGAWSAQLGANLISVTGNANAVTGKLSAIVGGSFDGWATEMKATAAYGQTRPEQQGAAPQVTALNADLRLRGDRRISGPVSAYLAAGAATDHVASIELEAYGEAGASIVWVEDKVGDLVRMKLRTDVGFRVTQENRFQYFPVAMNVPDDTIYAPRIAVDLRYALTKTSVITESVEVLPDVVNVQNLRVSSTTLLGAQIASGLSLQLGFNIRYIGAPAPGKKTTDTELSAGISVSI